MSLALSVATPQAFAQAAGASAASAAAPLSQSLTGEALKAYSAAMLLFQDGDAAGALAKLRHAHDLSHDARLLWNMAVCEKELRHYASSARLVTQYLAEAKALSAESRANAQQTLDALRGFYSEVTLVGLQPGAALTIDGESVGTAPLTGPVPVDLGRRRLRVQLSGFEPFERLFDVPGADPIEIRVELVKLRQTAALAIASAGARDVITVDDKVVGSGHWQGDVEQGAHAIRVTAPGKKAYEAHLELAAGASKSLQITLQDDSRGLPVWAWVASGAAVAVGAGVGGYFLLKKDDTREVPRGELGTIHLPLRFP
jgi:hypothetical protein